MNFPGQSRLRHWFWILTFKHPWLRVALTRALISSRDMDVRIFGANLHINTREEIGPPHARRTRVSFFVMKPRRF